MPLTVLWEGTTSSLERFMEITSEGASCKWGKQYLIEIIFNCADGGLGKQGVIQCKGKERLKAKNTTAGFVKLPL